MILRECIFAYSHIETALEIARSEPALHSLLSPLKHALEEIRLLQGEITAQRLGTSNVVHLTRAVRDRRV